MTILVIAAHPDDEVLGCGGSIAKWTENGESVHVLIMATGVTSRDGVENLKDKLRLLEESAKLSCKILGVKSLKILKFPDNRMDSEDRLDVIKAIELEIALLKPHTVVTHFKGDLNIDHQIVSESVLTACRPQAGFSVRRLLAFEIGSSTEWQSPSFNIPFQPNFFEDITSTLSTKIKALKCYKSEIRDWPHPRSILGVEYTAKNRGGSIGCDAAEAFILLREIR